MRKHIILDDSLLRRYPADPWRLVENQYNDDNLGHSETLFAVCNGYLGMRGNPEEGRNAHTHGTYVNGFHETWNIAHAEDAYGLAKQGQTLVNAPDGKLIKLYIDDEPLVLATADLEKYERSLDFRTGILRRELLWRTPSGKRVSVVSERMASVVHRHLALLTFEVTLLDGDAPVVISSQLQNRQAGQHRVESAAVNAGLDPRVARKMTQRVLEPRERRHEGNEVLLGFRCVESKMTLACGYRHTIECELPVEATTTVNPDNAKTEFKTRAHANKPIRLTKLIAYHSSTGVPGEELLERCSYTLQRAEAEGEQSIKSGQVELFRKLWEASDIAIESDVRMQQAVRWNLYQLIQASVCVQDQGIAAKALTSNGYDGHYFWDTEMYVIPFLAYTNPGAARGLLRFRWHMLPAARKRARELSQVGALYPWRTINGEEASAYYPAGTAQYHVNAAVVYALRRYVEASQDIDFLENEGVEILVETSRLWVDLGFYAKTGDKTFHIHGVTGPDEYTAVVNDNAYTNFMAQYCLRYAADVLRNLQTTNPERFNALALSLNLESSEIDAWSKAAEAMFIPYDEKLGIIAQDDAFLSCREWDWANVPDDKYPLLKHFHPLVIYRHQVLKQADVTLALFLLRAQFTKAQVTKNFDYYDPRTTGDSSLSACIQGAVAAQIGKNDQAVDYFKQALFLDLCNTHENTSDGAHIASTGGVWACFVHGFAGLIERGDCIEFRPNLPEGLPAAQFNLQRQGCILNIKLDHKGLDFTVLSGHAVSLLIGHERHTLGVGETRRIENTESTTPPSDSDRGAPFPDVRPSGRAGTSRLAPARSG